MSFSVEFHHRTVTAELLHNEYTASDIIRDTGYATRTVCRTFKTGIRHPEEG